MKSASCLLVPLLVASSVTLTACIELSPAPAAGTIAIALVGTAPSGISYRLRDATITVQGPGSTRVWNTEDAPDQTTLSADVAAGDYTALLADGWRLERIDAGSATPVSAVLVSDNPARFTVAAGQRTAVPLHFQVAGDDVDLTGGYDITLTVDDPPAPVMVVLNEAKTITVYPASADGNVSPLRTIAGPHTLLNRPIHLVVAGDRIVVCDDNAIDVFALSASGDASPITRIAGPATGLVGARSVVVSNGEIYVVQNNQTISVFPLTASGNVTPTRTITNTGTMNELQAVIDHDEIYLLEGRPGVLSIPPVGTVVVFPVAASGDTAPTRVMQLAPSPDLAPEGLAIRGDELFVLMASTIDVMPRGADGEVAPLRSLSPLSGVFQMVEFRNELYVAGFRGDRVLVFSADASGTVAPTRTISGPSTQLAEPLAVAVH